MLSSAVLRPCRAEEQEIARQRSVLAPEAVEQRRQAFQGKVIDLQKRIQERSQSLEKMLNSVRDQVTLQVVEILKGLAQERGFNIVLDRAQVQIFIGENIDITAEVLKRLDQRLPSVKVALPFRNHRRSADRREPHSLHWQ